MKKRLLALVLAMTLLLSAAPIPVGAAGGPAVAVSSGSAYPGRTVQLTVSAEDLVSLASLDLEIYYDSAALKLKSAGVTDLLSGSISSVNTATIGVIKLSAASLEGISGSGKLLNLSFSVNNDCVPGVYPVDLAIGDAYSTSLETLTLSSSSGSITVTEKPAASETFNLAFSADRSTLSQGESVTLTVQNSSRKNFACADFSVVYDSEVFQLESAVFSDKLVSTDGVYSINTAIEGTVRGTYASAVQTNVRDIMSVTLTAIQDADLTSTVSVTVSDAFKEDLTPYLPDTENKTLQIVKKPEEIVAPKLYLMPEDSGIWQVGKERGILLMLEEGAALAAADFRVNFSTDLFEVVSVSAAQGASELGAMITLNPNYADGSIRFSYINQSGYDQGLAIVRILIRPISSGQEHFLLCTSAIEPVEKDQTPVVLDYLTLTDCIYAPDVTEPGCLTDGYTTWRCHGCSASFKDSPTPALGHSFNDYQKDGNATCTQDGTKTAKCDRCDATDTQPDNGSATGHSYEAVITLPTCTQSGFTIHTCYCGDSYRDSEVPALGHSFTDYISNNDASCTQDGTKTAKCDRCDVTDTQPDNGSAAGHSYEAVITLPTCTDSGYTTYTCHCGDWYTDDEVPALGHRFDNWIVTETPDCTEKGSERRTCSECGYSETREIDPLGHSYTPVITAPTCLEAGYTTYICHCGDSYRDSETPALGHSFTKYVSNNDATCTEDGTKTAKCDRCDVTDTQADPGSAIGHNYQAVIVPPNCTDVGYTSYTCHCGHGYTGNEVPALGHRLSDWLVTKEPDCTEKGSERRTCSECGYFETQELDALGHSYTPVITAPTCSEAGYTTHTCHCGHSYRDSQVPATGHSFGEWSVAVDPKCEEAGYEQRECSRCQLIETQQLAPVGHTFDTVVTEPDCLMPGYTTHTCHCGYSYQDAPVEALGHDYAEWIVDSEPSCEEAGAKHRICRRCLSEEIFMLDALGHQNDMIVVEPSCTEPGYTAYSCIVCGHSFTSDPVAPLGHNFGEWETELEATCTERGQQSRTCTACDGYETRETEAIGHQFSDYVSDGNATCTEDGTMSAACNLCNIVDTVADPGSTVGHQWDQGAVTTEPEPGKVGEKTFVCENCGETRTEPVPALPEIVPCSHGTVKTVGQKAASCTETGYTGDRVCMDCGETLEEGALVPATGHSPVVDAAVAPTCTRSGLTEGSHCSVCAAVLTAQTKLSATGHSFGEWIELIPATSQESGKERRSCVNCGLSETRSIAILVNPFIDVAAGAYYEIPVLWAVGKGITNGMGPNTFEPERTCTRNQVVTFLWRAAGSPEPESNGNPFTDVLPTDYFYKAVLWAVEKGITTGTSSTTFSPDATCTRAQVATFLWRSQGKPGVGNAVNTFKDVASDQYYYTAVLWAVENGVTNGMGEGRFAPDDSCTRGQIVTFLYRALK